MKAIQTASLLALPMVGWLVHIVAVWTAIPMVGQWGDYSVVLMAFAKAVSSGSQTAGEKE